MTRVDLKITQDGLKRLSVTRIEIPRRLENRLIKSVEISGYGYLDCNLSEKDRKRIGWKKVMDAQSGLTPRVIFGGETNGIFTANSVFIVGLKTIDGSGACNLKIEENNFRLYHYGDGFTSFWVKIDFRSPTTIELQRVFTGIGIPGEIHTYSSRVNSVT